MKKLYILIFLLTSTFLNAQIVNIPDANFKIALIEVGVDTNNDGEIQVSEAEVVVNLNVNFKNISSLEGIESFINLEVLQCYGNQLIILDMSQNINLHLLGCGNNQINNLILTQNINLRTLVCDNNQLSELDISGNVNLESLGCSFNQLNSLGLSGNSKLDYLECTDNQLNSLFLDNGNNNNMTVMISTGNENLMCIQVDDENATYPECGGFPLEGWCKDDWSSYSEDCSLSLTDLKGIYFSLYPNPATNRLYINATNPTANLKVKILNIEGKLIRTENLEIQDQTSIGVSNLKSGLYLLNIEDENGNKAIKKFLKE
ncbi:T9SS type A sorting domain-containing protein [Aequorivita lipolytica]|uniref:T9SS type A sorting domain-containing protein n=1 Tax=Aequorivita lipolytica TaxID=153267 RepID=A0A5C6YSW4_9FLAO|nr:T9SS type A sorting domain-containing protein [Aequorivita lipolytica]TXD70133.1 T9SS type A sorting domain-containing protein [Aequorivita lipolytica]SRX50547.1 Internalin-J [Aequorivita lipolytica]